MEKGNFIQRYQKIKQELMEAGLKRTGYNDNKGYYYFQLSDFLPTLLRLEEKYGITDIITFDHGQATISLFDATENEVKPMIQSSMPFPKEVMELDTNKMKQLGGAETYCRRYLYFAVFNMTVIDIAELKTDMEEPAESNREIPEQELPFYQEPWKEEKLERNKKNIQKESIEEILKSITKKEALQTKMPVGPYKDMRLEEIISKDQVGPGFLQWLIQQGPNGIYGNHIIAAAYKLYNEYETEI